MKISVVYALPGRQVVREFDLDRETTVAEAIRHSGLPVEFPEIGANTMLVGIYGKVCWRRPKIDQFLRVVPDEN